MTAFEEAMEYQRGADLAKARLNAGLDMKHLRAVPIRARFHSKAFENGYYDELAFRDIASRTVIVDI